MAKIYHVPFYIRLNRLIFRPLFRLLFRLLARVKISGAENVPAHGAYLIAINHVSLYEAPFLLAFWPAAPEAVGAADLWSRPGIAFLARLYGGIPLNRGQYDRQVLDIMLTVLKAGRPLLIAPEGGRSHTPGMRRALPGAAYVIDLAQVPVVPVGVVGTTDDLLQRAFRLQRPTVEMRIGRPVRLPAVEGKGDERREARQRNADRIMGHIAALLPEAYRGVYAGQTSSEEGAAETA